MKNIIAYEQHIFESETDEKNLTEQLIDAIDEEKIQMISYLLNYGADPNSLGPDGISAMHVACGTNTHVSMEIMKKLLDGGGNVNVEDEDGYTPLNYVRHSTYLMDFLINKGANVLHVANNGDTLLHSACAYDASPVVVSFIIGLKKINVDAKNDDGETPLMLCVNTKSNQGSYTHSIERSNAKILIEEGNADPFTAFTGATEMMSWFDDDKLDWVKNERIQAQIEKMKHGAEMFGTFESSKEEYKISEYLLEGYYTQEGEIIELHFSLDESESVLIEEAEYKGRKVKLGKPFRTPGGPKKFSVYVKNPKGNVVKVNFGHKGKGGEKTMRIKKSDPARRKSFRARHNCDTPGPRHKARYWSCRFGWPSSGKGAIDKT